MVTRKDMKVDFLASEVHYVEHMLPIYVAMPEEARGEFIIGGRPENPDRLTVVSAFGDYKLLKGPAVFMEHGCGLSYSNNHPSYAGAPDRENVALFLDVNERTRALNAAAHPHVKGVVVGDPKLDAWLARGPKARGSRPTVAFSHHWDCKVVPETRSAFPHFKMAYVRMARQRGLPFRMLGHGHPRAWQQLGRFWREIRIDAARFFSDVVSEADVYVCDNSSTIYEFAALDRPVVVLNAPFYRKNVNHGLRFWEHVPGEQVDEPQRLSAAILRALRDDPFAEERRRAVDEVYPVRGNSAQVAADAICGIL